MKKLILALACLWGSSAFADPVTMRIGFNASGPISELKAFIDKATALQAEINPGSGNTATVLADVSHGANVSGASIVLTYKDLAAWAKAGEINESSAEWGELMQTFPADSFALNFQGLSNVLWRSSDVPAKSGEMLYIFVFAANEGPQALVAFAKKADAMTKKLGIESHVTLLTPIAAGPATGTITVALRFANAGAWAAARATQEASAEWGQMMATFPAAAYALNYQGLSRVM